jgi:hypothetical protein
VGSHLTLVKKTKMTKGILGDQLKTRQNQVKANKEKACFTNECLFLYFLAGSE